MSPVGMPVSPAARGEQRKFVNPTSGWVGANIFGPDGKPTAIPVEPGGEVWLTPEEERMTAEAPRDPADNPFVKAWEEAVEFDTFGEPVRTVTRQGVLVLSEEPPRPIASNRFIPPREEEVVAETTEAETPPPSPEPEETVTGAPPQPEQPPVVGTPSPDEVVGSPDAGGEKEPTADDAPSSRASRRSAPVADDSGEALPV